MCSALDQSLFADDALELIACEGRTVKLVHQALDPAPDSDKPWDARTFAAPVEDTVTVAFAGWEFFHEEGTRVRRQVRVALLAALDAGLTSPPTPKDKIEDPDGVEWGIVRADPVAPGTVPVYYDLRLVRQ